MTMFFTDMNWFWAISSVVTLILFLVYINKAKNPFITPKFLKNPAFVATMTVIFIGYFFSYTLNAGVNAIGLNVFGIDEGLRMMDSPSFLAMEQAFSTVLTGISV